METQLQANQAYKRIVGLELSGPHSSKTSLVVLDYYPSLKRLVLSQIFTGLGPQEDQSSDSYLIHVLKTLHKESPLQGLCTQAPLSLPPYFRPDSEKKSEERWMRESWEKIKPKPHPFVSYLNRPADVWMRYFTPERFPIPEALGSNLAPLTSRMHVLRQDFSFECFETHPRSSFHRITHSLGMSKFWPQFYSDIDRGLETRQNFFESLLQKTPQLFVYEKDLETLVLDINAFHAFVSALTLFLEEHNQCDSVPKNFPSSATWILLPRQHIRWNEIFKSDKNQNH